MAKRLPPNDPQLTMTRKDEAKDRNFLDRTFWLGVVIFIVCAMVFFYWLAGDTHQQAAAVVPKNCIQIYYDDYPSRYKACLTDEQMKEFFNEKR